MDAEKVAEVEMKALSPAEKDQDAEKGNVEETKEAEKKSEDKEAKKVFGSKKSVYSKLKNPTENIQSRSVPVSTPKHDEDQEKEGNVRAQKEEKAEGGTGYIKLKNLSENMNAMTSSTPQHKDVYRKFQWYKRISAVFIILSLLLLAVVLTLAIKLQAQSSQRCPNEQPPSAVKMESSPKNPEYKCFNCEKGWVKFQGSCYYISKDRLSWQESRAKCQIMGGDLVVINSEIKQRFLSKHWAMMYWIGLSYSKEHQWMWIDNTAQTQSGSYWGIREPKPDSDGSCALLKGRTSYTANWITNPCMVLSQYICQSG